MKTFILLLSVISINCFAAENSKDKRYSIGLGYGAMYSGVGTNLSFISKNDLKYISLGCVEYSSSNGSVCGFGGGWIKTDLFGANSNKHGVGVYVSLVDNESYTSYTSTTEGVEYRRHESNVYGAGLSYTYFMSGIDKAGTTFGVAVHATNADHEESWGGFVQIGYQF